MTGTLVLVADFTARPDTVQELTVRLLELAEASRAEDGCLYYDLHVDEEDPLRLTFLEEWADDDAHAAHDGTAHVAAFRAEAPRLLDGGVRLRRMRRVTTLASP